MRTVEVLRQRLEMIYQWHRGMVNPDTGMLEYLYLPQADAFVRERCPIREIASVWDVERISQFLNRRELFPLIEKSLRYYDDYLVGREGVLILDPGRLAEPSSIAHSAFMILALTGAPGPRKIQRITALAEGILRQQRPDGSYKIYFHDLPDQGEELYAGEAMLALLEAYRQAPDARLLESVERGFSYYDAQYFRRGRVAKDILVFFANWQSQACRLLFEFTTRPALKREVAGYVYRLHDQIIEQGFYEKVERSPFRLASVEVACALEGLNDAYAIARAANDDRVHQYRRSVCVGLAYLLRLQCVAGGTERERGGFGMSLQDRTQRIDIAGHAASAFMKSAQNGMECDE
ncbi:MAG TPA: hypothetical protein VIM99_01280 [Blastocatellia bacterium]